jgi:hypothetical protein
MEQVVAYMLGLRAGRKEGFSLLALIFSRKRDKKTKKEK